MPAKAQAAGDPQDGGKRRRQQKEVIEVPSEKCVVPMRGDKATVQRIAGAGREAQGIEQVSELPHSNALIRKPAPVARRIFRRKTNTRKLRKVGEGRQPLRRNPAFLLSTERRFEALRLRRVNGRHGPMAKAERRLNRKPASAAGAADMARKNGEARKAIVLAGGPLESSSKPWNLLWLRQ